MTVLALDPRVPYRELRDPPLDESLRALALDCFAAQRRTLAPPPLQPGDASAGSAPAVSVERLRTLLAEGRTVGGIASEREIATAIPFNVRIARGVVWSRPVARQRRRLDRELGEHLSRLFGRGQAPVLFPAGHWWYPPGTHLGWHTNERFPGWRLYLSHSAEPGRSFFRYRDPLSGEIVTSPDGSWDLRLFEVSRERPLWHTVWSDTDRFSIGWIVKPWSVRDAAALRVKQALEDLRNAVWALRPCAADQVPSIVRRGDSAGAVAAKDA